MSDHLVLYVDRLARPVPEPSEVAPEPAAGVSGSAGSGSDSAGPSCSAADDESLVDQGVGSGEEEPLIQIAECRICQEEDSFNNLETPCACSGSVKVYLCMCVYVFCLCCFRFGDNEQSVCATLLVFRTWGG